MQDKAYKKKRKKASYKKQNSSYERAKKKQNRKQQRVSLKRDTRVQFFEEIRNIEKVKLTSTKTEVEPTNLIPKSQDDGDRPSL